MRLRRRRERSESPEVAPTREKRIDPVNELRRALKNCRSMRECLDRLDTRTLRAVRNAATHLLDARLDDAWRSPSRLGGSARARRPNLEGAPCRATSRRRRSRPLALLSKLYGAN